jgi:hypothetical protein
MTGLTLFGLVAVTAMLLTYSAEKRAAGYVLAFAAACVLASVYGFLQGAWPFGMVEAIWSLVALRRWWHRHKARAVAGPGLNRGVPAQSETAHHGNGDSA